MHHVYRYLARKAGLNGANEKEATAVDMIMEAVEVSYSLMSTTAWQLL